MAGRSRRQIVSIVVAAGLLSLCLFASSPHAQSSSLTGPLLKEVQAALRDPATQWMVFACLAVYFVTFMVIGRRQAERFGAHGVTRPTWGLNNSDFWLVGGLLIVTFAYAFNYPVASKSTEALTLLAGVTLGKAARVWAGWGEVGRGTPCALGLADDLRLPNGVQGTARPTLILCALVFLLAASALWRPETTMQYQYRGQGRWSGPWDNPNIFGMLMGVGVVLAIGQTVLSLRSNVQSLKSGCEPSTFNLQPSTTEAAYLLRLLFLITAACVCGLGLVKSYSRGAWLGTAVGLAFLLWSWIKTTAHLTPALSPPSGGRRGRSPFVLFVSFAVA